MIITGINSASFLRTLLSISAAYMNRAGEWERKYMPRHIHGLTEEALNELRSPYDFIIVGSGYAGSIVASRLANTGCYRVLLVEAGDTPAFDYLIPFIQPLENNTKSSWSYKTVSQRYAAHGLKHQEVPLRAGKALGGSSLIESGVYLPENPDDFDRWADRFSLTEWSKKEVEPYFFKVKGASADGKGGSATDEQTKREKDQFKKDLSRKSNPLSLMWIQAGAAMGYPIMRGIESKMYEQGAFFVPNLMAKNGIKMTPATQFLSHVNTKLTILTGVEATKVMFDKHLYAAIGVQLRDESRNKSASARSSREVILSAGGIGSAKLLVQSGIGPLDHLDELKIPSLLHLPVGARLRDRVRSDLFVAIRSIFPESLRKKLADMEEVKEYFMNGTGLLASSALFGAAILKTNPDLPPDLLIEMKPIGILGLNEMESELNYDERTKQAIDPDGSLRSDGGLQITLTVLNPHSVGSMWLQRRFNRTRYDPVVNPSYLQDDRDLATLVKGALFVEAMIESDYMKLLNAQLIKPNFHTCPKRDNNTAVDYWRCVLRLLATSGGPISSTNAMLQVTEPDLKVRGVQRLRVVDESVFPEPVTGGFPASIMAVANRGSQLIIDDNQHACFKRSKLAKKTA